MRDDWHCDDAALTVLYRPLKPREVIKLAKLFVEDMARWRLEQQMERPPKRRFVEPEGVALEALRIKILAVNDRLVAKAETKRSREVKAADAHRAQRIRTRMLRRRSEYL